MPDVDLQINGAVHRVGCADGEETRLRVLAGVVDRHAQSLAQEMGVFSESRLFLMAALMIADELADANDRIVSLEAGGPAALYRSDAVEWAPPADSGDVETANASTANREEELEAEAVARGAADDAAPAVAEIEDVAVDAAENDAATMNGALVDDLSSAGLEPGVDGAEREMEASFARVMLRAADRLDSLAERLESA